MAGAAYESGEFTVTMSMYYDEPRTTPLLPNAEIQVLDFMYVTIQLAANLFDSQFYVQVRDGLKAMALHSMSIVIVCKRKEEAIQRKAVWGTSSARS